MTAPNSTPARAAALVLALQAAGKTVRAVETDGRLVRVLLSDGQPVDEVDACDRAFGTTRGKG